MDLARSKGELGKRRVSPGRSLRDFRGARMIARALDGAGELPLDVGQLHGRRPGLVRF